MGTFHDNLGELHGITVLVRTRDGRLIVGRCHEAGEREVILLDADEHPGGPDDRVSSAGGAQSAWLDQARRWGVFPRHKTMRLERGQVVEIVPLGCVTA